jgi:ADP-heptose:LPS heptosyltransferase
METVLVHLAAGIGNVVLATPLLAALEEMGFRADVRLDADYPGTAELLHGWSAVATVFHGPAMPPWERYRALVPAVPPFYWGRFSRLYRGRPRTVARPPAELFYRAEQEWYLSFARALGYPPERRPLPRLPVAAGERWDVGAETVVLAPGCKTGEMAAKRWPYFAGLARMFDDVALAGTSDDLAGLAFPAHVRSFVDRLTLRETAELLAGAGVAVANDSGLGHIAAAVGTPAVLIFGPTPDRAVGPFPPSVRIVRAGLPCEPCWFASPLAACRRRVDCLRAISVETVAREVRAAFAGEPAWT